MFYVKSTRRKPEVQLAPLIDMVFLLLIFFMVATIFPEDLGIEVSKPQSSTSNKLPRENLLFLIGKGGDIWFSGRQVGLAEVGNIVKSQVMLQPDIMVVVDSDRQAETDSLIKFLDEARKGGATNLAIGTKEKIDRNRGKNNGPASAEHDGEID